MGKRLVEVILLLVVCGVVVSWFGRTAESPPPKPTPTHSAEAPVSRATPEAATTSWDPFTERARKGIVAGQEAAVAANMTEIDCRVFVIGLRQSDPQIDAYLTLRKVELTLSSTASESPPDLLFTDGAQNTLEFAFEEARSEGSDTIDTRHLFIGILRTDSPARKELNAAGVTLEDFKEWLTTQE